jgi:glycosyltransferase involved in cell wall biosynthesis
MRTLSIVMPALNEETNIVPSVNNLLPDCRRELDRFELILVNDGSTDRTGEVMEELARQHPEIVVIHHPQRCGVGVCYRDGIARASMDCVTLIPGDNICDPVTWKPMFQAIGTAEIVVGYRANQRVSRPLYRVIISRIFSNTMCLIHGIKLRDFQGLVIYPTRMVRELGLQSTGFMYQMELMVQLHRRGCRFVETPFYMFPEDMKSSHSLRLETIVDLVKTLWRLRKR